MIDEISFQERIYDLVNGYLDLVNYPVSESEFVKDEFADGGLGWGKTLPYNCVLQNNNAASRGAGSVERVKKTGHCEAVRTLPWQSPKLLGPFSMGFSFKMGDSHTT